jgi:hypothetical protein
MTRSSLRFSIVAGVLLAALAGCATQPNRLLRPRRPRRPRLRKFRRCHTPTHPGLTLAAVGDVMLGTDFPENILPDDDGVGFLQAVTPILSAPDVASEISKACCRTAASR